MSIFHEFHPRLQNAIVNQLGWRSLRDVQEMASSAILNGDNVIILSPTAGGKTEAAIFPVISSLLSQPCTGINCLYISPLRALLNNLETRIQTYSRMVGLNSFKWHGEVNLSAKNNFAKEPCEILMITPESLEGILVSAKIPTLKWFSQLKFIIVDEIHALASCDRGGHLLALLEKIRSVTNNDFQRLGLSATVGNPNDISKWIQGSSTRKSVIVDPPKIKSKKRIEVKFSNETEVIKTMQQRATQHKSIFFCQSRSQTEKIGKALDKYHTKIFVHHSSVANERRTTAENEMLKSDNLCIISTSTLELGIDVGELDYVFQSESPVSVSSFLQRMGRTGRRAGKTMNTTFFCSTPDTMLQAIAIVEMARNHWVEEIHLSHRSWHLLVHQLMVLCLEHGAILRQKSWQLLQKAWCFSGISKEEWYSLIDYLIGKGLLFEESGLLSIGVQAEKIFGYKNFLKLYSVFSSPEDFKVETLIGKQVGTIEMKFAYAIRPGYCFLLSGRSWIIERIEYNSRTIYVQQAPFGRIPKWGNYAPKVLDYEVCRKIYDVLVNDKDYPYCDPKAKKQLHEVRQNKLFLRRSFAPMYEDQEGIVWWTYAGAKVNNALFYAICAHLKIDGTVNNYSIQLNNTTIVEIKKLSEVMSEKSFWDDAAFQKRLQNILPMRHLSKFQNCLPLHYQLELVAHHLLDITNAIVFLKNWRH